MIVAAVTLLPTIQPDLQKGQSTFRVRLNMPAALYPHYPDWRTAVNTMPGSVFGKRSFGKQHYDRHTRYLVVNNSATPTTRSAYSVGLYA